MSENFDLNSLLGQAMEMQQQLVAAQAQAAQAEVTGRSGGGAVSITVSGGLDFKKVEIRPDAVDPDDVPMLEDLVLAALNDAMDQLGQLQESSLGGLDLGGMPGLGDLGALGLGGGPSAEIGIEGFLDAGIIDEDELEDDEDDDEPEGPAGGATPRS